MNKQSLHSLKEVRKLKRVRKSKYLMFKIINKEIIIKVITI